MVLACNLGSDSAHPLSLIRPAAAPAPDVARKACFVIDFRYHLVSVIAIFMALAVGIVLGSGPLKPAIDQALTARYEEVQADREVLRQANAELERRGEYRDAALEEMAPALLGQRLAGRRVALVTSPAADGELVAEVAATLEQSGATISSRVGIGEDYLDASSGPALDELLDRLAPAGAEVPDDVTTYVRAGDVLGRALMLGGAAPGAAELTDDAAAGEGTAGEGTAGEGTAGGDPATTPTADGAEAPDEATDDTTADGPATDTLGPVPDATADGAALLAGLAELGLIEVEGEPAERASLAVVVSGPGPEEVTDETTLATQALGELVRGLDRQGEGAVVVGPVEAAGDGGLITYVRATESTAAEVSTVDTIDTTIGRISAVFALVGQSLGRSGHYGLGDDADVAFPDLPVPEPVPTPSAP